VASRSRTAAARGRPARRGSARLRRLVPRLTATRLAVGLLLLVGFLYYRPITAYVDTRAELDRRAAQVDQLRRERQELDRVATGEAAIAAEARRLGLIRPGERLFIVEGIAKWRRAYGRRTAG
jgi:cell division protein FtsB